MQFQEKASSMMDKASNAAQSAKESMQQVIQIEYLFSHLDRIQIEFLFSHLDIWIEFLFSHFQGTVIYMFNQKNKNKTFFILYMQAGQQMQEKAQGAADAMKNATGTNQGR